MKVLLIKAQVKGYTRKDGTYVNPHHRKDSGTVAHEDPERTFYHVSSDENFRKIEPDKGRFGGGVFALRDKDSAKRYGTHSHKFHVSGRVMSNDEFVDEIDDREDDVREWLAEFLGTPEDDDVMDGAIWLLKDESRAMDGDPEYATADALIDYFRAIDASDLYAEVQKMRGNIAKRLGASALQMNDEFDGDTHMLLHGDGVEHRAVETIAKSHHLGWKPPTPAQAAAGNYKKPRVKWNGLEIAIENPAGSVREGKGWRTKMKYDYGYVCRSEAVDGDEVDVYLGPELETASTVYVVHQRKYGDWKAYDEDKAMLGFASEKEAREAYLKHYDDPRFLGPITAMPVDEFVKKVRATREKPAMIKAVMFIRQHTSRLDFGSP